jgi:hypothetical protein
MMLMEASPGASRRAINALAVELQWMESMFGHPAP